MMKLLSRTNWYKILAVGLISVNSSPKEDHDFTITILDSTNTAIAGTEVSVNHHNSEHTTTTTPFLTGITDASGKIVFDYHQLLYLNSDLNIYVNGKKLGVLNLDSNSETFYL